MGRLVVLVVALCGTSCVVPPSCIDRVFGLPSDSPRAGHFATLTLYSEPVEGPVEENPSAGAGIGDRFVLNTFITIDDRGRMAVSRTDVWPRSCPKISGHELAAVSQLWQPILERIVTPHPDVPVVANATTGRPDGPLLSLQFGPLADPRLGVLWDGRSTLSTDLEAAVMATLELMCSNSRLAERYLLRDLPREVASRLECH